MKHREGERGRTFSTSTNKNLKDKEKRAKQTIRQKRERQRELLAVAETSSTYNLKHPQAVRRRLASEFWNNLASVSLPQMSWIDRNHLKNP